MRLVKQSKIPIIVIDESEDLSDSIAFVIEACKQFKTEFIVEFKNAAITVHAESDIDNIILMLI